MSNSFTDEGGDNEHWDIDIAMGAILDALEADPRFEAMIRRVLLKGAARRTTSLYGQYAQQQGQQGPAQQRIT